MLAQDRHDGLGNPQRAEEVEVQLRPGLGFGELLDHAHRQHSGVVDDDVEPAEVADRLGDGGEHRVAIGHVHPERQDLTGVGGRKRLQRGCGAGRDRDAVAAHQRCFGEGVAEAPARAGDEPDAADGVGWGVHVRYSCLRGEVPGSER